MGHWGRKTRTKGSRSHPGVMVYLCCQGDAMSTGCSFNPKHFTDMIKATEGERRTGYVETMPVESGSSSPKNQNLHYPGIYALDCEMCSTTMGNELTRVTVINLRGKTVYESMVLPNNEIIDYNTRFSGITSDHKKVVDTCVVFPHKMGPPYKKSLRQLSLEY